MPDKVDHPPRWCLVLTTPLELQIRAHVCKPVRGGWLDIAYCWAGTNSKPSCCMKPSES